LSASVINVVRNGSGEPDRNESGIVQDLSVVEICAPPAEVGETVAVQTSNGDRKTLKSSTSTLLRPSRKRTLIALTLPVVLTTDSSVLNGRPDALLRTV
jgi:hypothetical protein